jgi:hopanoid-associated phosphorylase
MIMVVGMAFESRIAAGPGVRVVCSGDGRRLAADLESIIADGCRGLISFGIAGGLSPGLRPGICVIATEIVTSNRRLATDTRWSQRLRSALPDALHGPLAGVPAALTDPAAKRALHHATGAIAVDMESHVVADIAAARGLPMTAIRVIADPAERALPNAALAGMRPDGTTDVGAVIKALARRTRDLPALCRVALDTRAARAGLFRSRQMLGPGLALLDLGELAVDVT